MPRALRIKALFLAAVTLSACSFVGAPIDPEVSENHFHSRLGGGVVYGRGGQCLSLGCVAIEGAKAASFAPLSGEYGRDASGVYYKSRRLEGEAPEGFQFLGGFYAKGALGAYFMGEPFEVSGLDSLRAVTFEGDDGSTHAYALDEASVYCRESVLSSRPSAFRALERAHYFTDDEAVYFIAGGVCFRFDADPASFVFLTYSDGSPAPFAKDAARVFTAPGTSQIEGADAESFRALCTKSPRGALAVDARRVYDRGNVIEGATPGGYDYPEGCAPQP